MKILFLLISLFTTLPMQAYADDTPQKSSLESVLIYPKDQDKDTINYFKINWIPGAKEELGFKLKNNSQSAVTYSIHVNKALTNMNGIIEYYSEDFRPLEDVDLKELNFPSEITLNPNEETEIRGTLTLPNKDLNGFKMAGLVIQEKPSGTSNEGVSMQTVSKAFPIVFKGNIKGIPKHKISFSRFQFKRIGSKVYSINLPFENGNTNWISDVEAVVSIKDQDGNEVLRDERTIQITPNSEINYSPTFNEAFEAGTYDVTLTLTTDTAKWIESQEVTIDKDQEKEMEENQVTTIKEDNSTLITFLFIALIASVFSFLFVYFKNKK